MTERPRGRRGARLWTSGAAVCGGALVLALACDDEGTHIYQGRLFVEGRDCLGTASTLDVVDGKDPGACAAVCLVTKDDDGGRVVYVSTMCAPYPPDFDRSGSDPDCAPALAALARGDTCLADGGSVHPAPPADAAAD